MNRKSLTIKVIGPDGQAHTIWVRYFDGRRGQRVRVAEIVRNTETNAREVVRPITQYAKHEKHIRRLVGASGAWDMAIAQMVVQAYFYEVMALVAGV